MILKNRNDFNQNETILNEQPVAHQINIRSNNDFSNPFKQKTENINNEKQNFKEVNGKNQNITYKNKINGEKYRRSQTSFGEERVSQLRENNMRILNTAMKIKITNTKDRVTILDKELLQIYGKSESVSPAQRQKQKEYLDIKDLSNNIQTVENANELIMMRSLNEQDFKIKTQGSQSRDKSSKSIRNQNQKKIVKINEDLQEKPRNESYHNNFSNYDFTSEVPVSPKKGKFIPIQNEKKLEGSNQNNNQNEYQDDFHINGNITPKQIKQHSGQISQVQQSTLSKAITGIGGISNIGDNQIMCNQNECENESEGGVVHSFNSQSNVQHKEQTINIRMKDLRFFSNSKRIIVVDLQNPQKIEQLRKSKNMKEWFLRRKSQAANGEENQIRKDFNKNKQDITIPIQGGPDYKKDVGSEEKEETDELICKICFEGEEKICKDNIKEQNEGKSNKSKLLSPCLCQGSMKYIHEECLKEWIISKLCQEFHSYGQLQADLTQTKCEICKYTYRMEIQLGDRFLPRQAIKKGMKPFYLSLVTFLISCMLFYLAVHFTMQSIKGQTDKMEAGYSLGIGVCSGIVGCVFIFISIVCFKECLYVKKIVNWIIYNSERQKKIDSIQTQMCYKTYNGFKISQNQFTEQQNNDDDQGQNIFNISQQLNNTSDFNNQTNNQMITHHHFQQSDIMISNQIFQASETQNQSPSRLSPEQRANRNNIQYFQGIDDYNIPE